MFNKNFSILPDSICNLDQLKALEVNENVLSKIPECLGKLQNLKLLNLRKNKLTKLPDGLGELRELLELFVTDNPLTEIPASYERFKNHGRLVNIDLPDSVSEKSKKLADEIEKKNRRLY